MKHFSLLQCMVLFLITFPVFAQSPLGTSGSYAQFSNEPVGLFTGTPNINIPIGEISGRKLSVPIYLSYHSSGIKVDELASWVGLGWKLQAGGIITRSVRSNPDKINNYYAPDSNKIDSSYLADVVSDFPNYDSEPDVFYFNINGRSGSFVLDVATISNGETIRIPRCIPYQDLKINYTKAEDNENFDSWEIITEDGIRYIFGGDGFIERQINGNKPNTDLSWFLKEIITPNLEDTISFNYNPELLKYNTTPTEIKTFFKITEDCYPNECDHYFSFSENNLNTIILYTYRLQSIKSSLGKVTFYPQDSPRQDVSHDIDDTDIGDLTFSKYIEGGKVPHNTLTLPYALKRIVFTDENNEAFRTVHLTTTYSNERLWLNSVIESNPRGSSFLPPYEFIYNNIALPSPNSQQKDFYGYYNGSDTTKQIKILNHWNVNVVGRTINNEFAKAGVLEQVIFPDGGRIEYEYGGNIVINNMNMISRGGIRVNAIKTYDSKLNTVSVKKFEYIGEYNDLPIKSFLFLNVDYVRDNLTYRYMEDGQSKEAPMAIVNLGGTTYFSTNLGYEDGYQRVIEKNTYIEGGVEKSNGYVVYEYSTLSDFPDLRSTPKAFPDTSFRFSYQQPTSFSWRRGMLKNKYVYDANGKLLQKEEYQYDTSDTELEFYKKIRALQVEKIPSDIILQHGQAEKKYGYGEYYVLTGRTNLVSQKTTTYDQLGTNPISQSTQYFYSNSGYNQLDSIKKIDSKGYTINSRMFYPTNCSDADLSQPMKDTLLLKNIINPVIKKEVTKDQTIVSGQKTNLGYLTASSLLMPVSSSIYENESYHKKTFIDKYDDYGQVKQYHGIDNIPISMVYDYNNNHIVAKVVNAGYDDVVVQNFENEKGNTDICRTGKKGHDGEFRLEFPDSIGDYTLTYWNWTNDNWQLVKKTVKVINSDYYETILGTIDDIRVFPKDAFVTTFTYNCYGKTSETGPNYRTVYYEYDSFGRLSVIRDHDKNIVEKKEYNNKPFSFVSTKQIFFKPIGGEIKNVIFSDKVTSWSFVDNDGIKVDDPDWITVDSLDNFLTVSCSDYTTQNFVRKANLKVKFGIYDEIISIQQEPYLYSDYIMDIPSCNIEDIGRFETFDFFFYVESIGTEKPEFNLEVRINNQTVAPVKYTNQQCTTKYICGTSCYKNTNYKCTLYSGETGTKLITVKVLESGVVKKELSYSIIVNPNN